MSGMIPKRNEVTNVVSRALLNNIVLHRVKDRKRIDEPGSPTIPAFEAGKKVIREDRQKGNKA